MVEAASLKGPDAKFHSKDGGQLSLCRLSVGGAAQQLGSTLAGEVAQLHKARPGQGPEAQTKAWPLQSEDGYKPAARKLSLQQAVSAFLWLDGRSAQGQSQIVMLCNLLQLRGQVRYWPVSASS